MHYKRLGRAKWFTGPPSPPVLDSLGGAQSPITYAMHQESVYFRTLPDGLLAELAQPTSVALEVDELDQQTRSGWSIVLHGHTSAVRESDELADLWASDSLVPWASRNRTLFIRIRPDTVAGRIVRRPT
jgi:hypothetical protein